MTNESKVTNKWKNWDIAEEIRAGKAVYES
jgi:hypothetical protein